MSARNEHRHDVYHIVLVTDGAGSFLHRGRTVDVSRGSLVVTCPMEDHAFERLPGDTSSYHEVTWSGPTGVNRLPVHSFSDLLSDATTPEWATRLLPLRLEPQEHLRTATMLESIARTFGAGGQLGRFRATARLLALWEHIIELLTASQPPWSDPFSMAKAYVETRFAEDIDLPRLAATVGLSYNYLSRGFKQRYDQTPMRYLQQVRLMHAEALLRGTNYTHARIAEMVGICDEAYFSKVFKSRYGVAPREWRARSAAHVPHHAY